MCNPRRIDVLATRLVAEAWEREVRRSRARSGAVTGEARIRQPLDASVGAPAIAALERALSAGVAGWELVEGGYRYEVSGGYALYSLEDRSLTIASTRTEVVHGRGDAEARLSGRVEGQIEMRSEATYYDDGAENAAQAREAARRRAETKIDAEVRARLESAGRAAEEAADAALTAQADARAGADFEARAAARREALEREAAESLRAVGALARRAFHGLLARAYRDALLALARHRGAQSIQCVEEGDVLEIEFELPA